MIINKNRNIIKNKILKCLTEDFNKNQPIFDKKRGWAIYTSTNLKMVMNAVCNGLEMAKYEINNNDPEIEELKKEYLEEFKWTT